MRVSYDIGAGIECLVLAAILFLVVSPVGELDGGIGARGSGPGKRGDLVTLVAWLNLGDILHDLLCKLALSGGLFMTECVSDESSLQAAGTNLPLSKAMKKATLYASSAIDRATCPWSDGYCQ
jgi:hypothetical protein